MNDPFHLQRFVAAREPVCGQVCAELAAGAKTGHWMWFVFPQLQGLVRSTMAVRFGIAALEETRVYWQHDVVGPRLKECVEPVLAVKGRTAFQRFGTPDDLKLWSSMTLFAQAVPEEPLFKRALARYFDRWDDPRTLKLLARP